MTTENLPPTSPSPAALQHELEEELKRTNQTLATAHKMARLAYWSYDVASERIQWSDQMFALLGKDPAQGIPSLRGHKSFVHPDDWPCMIKTLLLALEKGASYDQIVRGVLPDRSIRWFATQGHPQRDGQGRIIGLNGILLDITDIKEAEVAKENLEAQLRQAQKMEAIGTITGGIAHDFNNILGIILGNAELALDGMPPCSPERKNIDEIVHATLRAKNIIQQLLSFSRKSGGQAIPVDLGAIVKESLRLIRVSLPPNITIRQTVDVAHPKIMADAAQIHQVLLNLCTNAMHAMEAIGGILEISIIAHKVNQDAPQGPKKLKPGDYVCLSVLDTGHGIAPECLDRIFDPYFTTKEVGKGSGLGLAVVHGIVQKHEAFITVESKINQGSIFHIYFPRLPKPVAPDRSAEPQMTGGSESILFVDDEPALVQISAAILRRLGYQVITADNGQTALDLIQTQPQRFDLVISDMTMPAMDGDALAEKIKAIRPDLPVLLCTGHSDKMDKNKAVAMGVHFTEKPLDRSKLAHLVREILCKIRTKTPPL